MRLSQRLKQIRLPAETLGGHVIPTRQFEEEAAELEEKLAEYENDETVRHRADAYKIRTLELIAIDAMEYFEADYSRPAFYYKAVKYMDGD